VRWDEVGWWGMGRTEVLVLVESLLLTDLEALGLLGVQVVVVVAGHCCGEWEW
jgi:hypothetical protein